MHSTLRHVVVLVFFLGGTLNPGHAFATYVFTTVNVPGATSTDGYGINDAGQIVGDFAINNGIRHGFLETGGNFTQIDVPGGTGTTPVGINTGGQIVGAFAVSIATHGFIDSGGNFTQVDVPGATFTSAFGVNTAGQVVGVFDDNLGKAHGFLRGVGGGFTPIDVPGATGNNALGINAAGQIVGLFVNGSSAGPTHGYLDIGNTFTQIDVPGATSTQANGINSTGQIVGLFINGTGTHGYLDVGGNFTQIDVPGATLTSARGINAAGQIVGFFDDNAGIFHGFLATPVVLPIGSTSSGAFIFNASVVGGMPIFIDPLVAIGYDYAAGSGDPLFASVTLPIGIGDSMYTLSFDGFTFSLAGGVSFDFTKYFAAGIDAFEVTGIETSAMLDPSDPTAFVTELTFVGSGEFTGTMTPITAQAPEPATLALFGLGLAGLGFSRRKHKSIPRQHGPRCGGACCLCRVSTRLATA